MRAHVYCVALATVLLGASAVQAVTIPEACAASDQANAVECLAVCNATVLATRNVLVADEVGCDWYGTNSAGRPFSCRKSESSIECWEHMRALCASACQRHAVVLHETVRKPFKPEAYISALAHVAGTANKAVTLSVAELDSTRLFIRTEVLCRAVLWVPFLTEGLECLLAPLATVHSFEGRARSRKLIEPGERRLLIQCDKVF